VLALLTITSLARADGVRVVLASTDAELVRALESALGPWQVTIETSDAEPGAAMPGSAARGRALAEVRGAAAAIWISSSEDGFALWVYDRASERVVSRHLPVGPPFDEATAAAVALSIKTLLRHSDAAPPEERLVVPEVHAPAVVRLELAGGTLALATTPADVEPRARLGVAVWPREVPWLGISLAAGTGTGIAIARDDLAARLLWVDAHAGLRARWAPDRALDLGLSLELGITVAILDAQLLPSGRSLTAVDVDPSARLLAELGIRPVDRLRIALRAGAWGTPRTRTYRVHGQRALDTSPVALVCELVVEIPLDGGVIDSR